MGVVSFKSTSTLLIKLISGLLIFRLFPFDPEWDVPNPFLHTNIIAENNKIHQQRGVKLNLQKNKKDMLTGIYVLDILFLRT